jgi:hypothetical protein
MNLESVAEMLEDAEVGIQGTDIFVEFIPASCSQGILLRQPFGGTQIDYDLPGYRKTSFMLIARAKTYSAGKTLIDNAVAALTVDNEEVTNMHINYMRPQTDPFFYAPSAGGNVEFVVHIDACYVIV